MPKISEFFGISIYVYYADHPPPHFHAIYGGEEAVVGIEDLKIIRGHLPPRALGLVIEWATQYREELKEVWNQAESHEALSKIPPLE